MVTAAASATRRPLRRFRARSKRGWDHSGMKTRATSGRGGPSDGRAFVTLWRASRWHVAVTVIARRPGVDLPGASPAMSSRTRGSRPAPRRARRPRRGWPQGSPVSWPRISGVSSGRTCGDGFPCEGFAALTGDRKPRAHRWRGGSGQKPGSKPRARSRRCSGSAVGAGGRMPSLTSCGRNS